MAKDLICGMFVEENKNSIHYTKNGITYYFCSNQCLNEFVEPEKEFKKLKDFLMRLALRIIAGACSEVIRGINSIFYIA